MQAVASLSLSLVVRPPSCHAFWGGQKKKGTEMEQRRGSKQWHSSPGLLCHPWISLSKYIHCCLSILCPCPSPLHLPAPPLYTLLLSPLCVPAGAAPLKLKSPVHQKVSHLMCICHAELLWKEQCCYCNVLPTGAKTIVRHWLAF